MQQLFRMRDAEGNDYDVPASDMGEFSAAVPNANRVKRYRDRDGNDYDVPDAELEEFRGAVPDAAPLSRHTFKDGTTRDFTYPELAKFLRSKEWRESDDYKADREERDRAVNAKLGEDGEMHSPAWAGVKGALKGAVQGAWQGGNAAANKIAKAIPEIGNSLESALGNTINLFGNAPNALGNWFLANSASGKAWLDANLPSETKEWTGYEDWSTKTADKFADVSAMAYKFAPAMATGGSTALVNTMFAADGINAASQTFDNAIENGFTMGEANAAAAASFLVNFYGAKLMTKAGGVAGDVSNPLLRFLGEAGAVGAATGAQGVGNKGIENVVNGRPVTEGMGDAFVEGEVEGFMFHGINAIPGAVMTGWSAAERRIRETRELKEYRRDSLLEVARGEGGGELLNTLLPGEGLDAAVRVRKSGEDVSRKIGERAGLPDNMSVAERNEIIDAIARARGERAAQNAVKIDGFRADALNEAIKGVVGGEEYADAIRAEVLSNIKSARELDNPVRRMELVEEAAQKVSAPDEQARAAAEHRAKSMAGMEERARRKADMAEYEKQEAERRAREEAEQNAPRITVSDLPAETPAAPAETGRGQFPEYYEWLDKTGKKDSDKNWRKFVAENDLDPALAGKRPEPPAEKPAEKPAVKPDGKGKMVPVEPKVPVEEAKKPEVAAEPPQKPVETSAVAETGKETPEPTKPVETPSRAAEATGDDAVSSYTSGMKPLERSRVTKVLNRRGVYEDGKTVAESISAFVGKDAEVRAQHNGKGGVDYIIGDTFGNKTEADFARHVGVKINEESILRAQEEASLFKTMKKAEQVTRSKGFAGGDFSVPTSDKALQEQIDKLNTIGKYQPEANTRLEALEAVKADRIKRGTWEGGEGISKTETTTPSAKPVPDGKGKMVKPKTSESVGTESKQDYGVTMFEEPAVDGNGVKYVVKDGPSDAHRSMFDTKEAAEARLAEIRDLRKRITEAPTAKLSDGTTVHLLKTDEGWVPFDEHYNDMRHGLYSASKTKAQAVKVAEKGKAWAKGVAEENKRVPDGKGRMVKPKPATPVETADAKALREGFDKTVKSVLSQDGRPIANLHDAAERLIDTIKERYEGDANVEKALDKALAEFKENNPLERFIKPSHAAEYFKEFADELAKKYEIPGYDGKVEPPKFNGREMKVGDVDHIQEQLFELRGKYADTPLEEDGVFEKLPFREIDAKKLGERDLKELKKLTKAVDDALFDIEMADDILEKDLSVAEDYRGDVEKFIEARDNLNRFLEQADRYQHLKRDKKGRPLFSRALEEPVAKDEKSKLQKIEPIEDAKTPEQEISERLDLKRLDPKRRSDPKVLAWAKRNGRTVTDGKVTPDAVRAYDEAMTEGVAKLAKHWFPDMKIVTYKFGDKIKRGVHVIEQRITDPETIAELEKDTVSRFRSMQLRDGKLYPPMAGKVKNEKTGKAEWQEPSKPGIWYKADEHPELLDKNGKFTLVKGNGETIKAAYNPYWHMSKTALNDQFSSAYKRPELVTVEVAAPRSEAEAKRGEGYWATGAKDPVGETKWPKGPVSGQLAKAGAPERKVTLTQHNKIVRVLSTEEVADRIKAEIDACPRKDVQVEVPFNCVTPQLRDALVERGVKIGKPARLSGEALKEANKAYETWRSDRKAVDETLATESVWREPRIARSVEEAATVVKSAGIVNKPLENATLKMKGVVTGNNLSEMKNEKAIKKSASPRLHALAVANVDRLFETAYGEITHPDTHGRKEVVQTHRLGSLLKDPLTGRYEPVMLTVLEYNQYGNRVYSIEAVDLPRYEKTPAGQLADSALPGITSRLREFAKSIAHRAEVVNSATADKPHYLRDTSGDVLGWFDTTSKEVHLLPGADPRTVAHEIMWHGTRDYITRLAAKGDKQAQKFLDMMHDVEKNIPAALKAQIIATYTKGAKAPTSDTLMNEFGAWFTMEKGGAALEKALQSAEGRNWFAKALYTVKEMYKSFLRKRGGYRVDLSAIDGMTRDEFVDFLAKEFASGKTLGNITDKGNELSTEETKFQAYRRKSYDNNAPVRDLERDIEKKTGRKISADDSVEAANALKYGLKEAANIEIQGKMADLRKSLGESGIHYEDLEYYAALKAAEGRDAKIDKRNIDKLTADMKAAGASAQDIADAIAYYKSTNGSHIDPREAKRLLAEIETGSDAAKYKEAYDKLRAVIEETLDTQVAAGLVDAKDAAKWRAEEPNYIPFKNEYDPDSGEWAGRGTSRNFVKPEHHMAKGRQSAAGDIIAHVFMDHQSAKHRAIENAVRQKLAKLVKANPELGKVELLRKDAVKDLEKNDPNVVVFKDGGRAYAIRLNGTRGAAIANAFTQRNLVKMGWADKGFSVFGKKITFRNFAHWSAGMATRYSPFFAFRNTTKDNIELANIVYSERGFIEGSKFMANYAANYVKMAKTLMKYVATGKINTATPEGQILDRYIKAGGLIAGGVRSEGMDTIKAKLSPEAIAKEMKRGKSKLAATTKHVRGSIGYLNEFAEMATRVGVFATEVKAGKSDAEAALFSRRVTVDFNRHGDWTPGFNLVRLFSNSTLGATARSAVALGKSKYGRRAALAMFANGLAQAVIEHFYNADEDERRRKTGEATGKDVSEFDRKTSLFYFRSGDNVYKVAQHDSPFSLITYAGNCVGRWLCGDMNGKDVAKNLGVSTAELAYNFLPMGSINLESRKGGFVNDVHAAVVSGVVPSVLQPIFELGWNVDFKGDPVLRTMMNEHDPKSYNGKEHTPEWAKQSAEWLNDSTGGNAGRQGFVDIAPEAIQKLVEGYGKNALRDVSAAYSVGRAIVTGDVSKLDPRNTPVKRDFVRPLDGNDRRFNDALSAYKADKNEVSKMKGSWTSQELMAYRKDHPWAFSEPVQNAVSQIAKLRKMEQGFWYKNGKATAHEWPEEKVEEFKARRRKLQAQVLELMGR